MYGFVIADAESYYIATLCGNEKKVLSKHRISASNKPRRGGQSANRIGRIIDEKRKNWIDQIAEECTKCFIQDEKIQDNNNKNKNKLEGIVIAGKAHTKNKIEESNYFDKRLFSLIRCRLDISYGYDIGFQHAIRMAESILADNMILTEKVILSKLFNNISMNKMYSIGPDQIMIALEAGAIEDLIIWDKMTIRRIEYERSDNNNNNNNNNNNKDKVKFLPVYRYYSAEKKINGYEVIGGIEYKLKSNISLAEWLMELGNISGTRIHIVSNSSSEGAQFVSGFGGIGGILRWEMDFSLIEDNLDNLDNKDSNDMDSDGFI